MPCCNGSPCVRKSSARSGASRIEIGLLALALASFASGDAMPPRQEAPAAEDEARPADADGLFARFARMPGLEVRFVEEKHLALLALPLKSEGRLYFLPPGHLTRVVEKPEPATLTISPEELRMADRDGEQVLDLGSNDGLRVFVTSLLQVFSGSRGALERSYTLVYAPDPHDEVHWTLTLTPKVAPLDGWMSSLTLRGKGAMVEEIELLEPGGDRTVTRVLTADPRRTFDAEEKQRLFGLGAAGPARKREG